MADMAQISFMNQTADVVRPVMVTEYGRTVADWSQSPAADFEVSGLSIQPGASEEVQAHRQHAVIRWTIFGPIDLDVRDTDAMRIYGRLYQVDGEPERWPSPTGDLRHTRIYLIDHEG